ncbi:MAG: hypothetical protein SangKO_076090 [Sandaracinaceae bacterium]
MRSVLILAGLSLLALGAGCGGPLREANLSSPILGDDGTVWWAEHRANARGSNDVRIIMCRPGERPVCVRVRPVDSEAQ